MRKRRSRIYGSISCIEGKEVEEVAGIAKGIDCRRWLVVGGVPIISSAATLTLSSVSSSRPANLPRF